MTYILMIIFITSSADGGMKYQTYQTQGECKKATGLINAWSRDIRAYCTEEAS